MAKGGVRSFEFGTLVYEAKDIERISLNFDEFLSMLGEEGNVETLTEPFRYKDKNGIFTIHCTECLDNGCMHQDGNRTASRFVKIASDDHHKTKFIPAPGAYFRHEDHVKHAVNCMCQELQSIGKSLPKPSPQIPSELRLISIKNGDAFPFLVISKPPNVDARSWYRMSIQFINQYKNNFFEADKVTDRIQRYCLNVEETPEKICIRLVSGMKPLYFPAEGKKGSRGTITNYRMNSVKFGHSSTLVWVVVPRYDPELNEMRDLLKHWGHDIGQHFILRPLSPNINGRISFMDSSLLNQLFLLKSITTCERASLTFDEHHGQSYICLDINNSHYHLTHKHAGSSEQFDKIQNELKKGGFEIDFNHAELKIKLVHERERDGKMELFYLVRPGDTVYFSYHGRDKGTDQRSKQHQQDIITQSKKNKNLKDKEFLDSMASLNQSMVEKQFRCPGEKVTFQPVKVILSGSGALEVRASNRLPYQETIRFDGLGNNLGLKLEQPTHQDVVELIWNGVFDDLKGGYVPPKIKMTNQYLGARIYDLMRHKLMKSESNSVHGLSRLRNLLLLLGYTHDKMKDESRRPEQLFASRDELLPQEHIEFDDTTADLSISKKTILRKNLLVGSEHGSEDSVYLLIDHRPHHALEEPEKVKILHNGSRIIKNPNKQLYTILPTLPSLLQYPSHPTNYVFNQWVGGLVETDNTMAENAYNEEILPKLNSSDIWFFSPKKSRRDGVEFRHWNLNKSPSENPHWQNKPSGRFSTINFPDSNTSIQIARLYDYNEEDWPQHKHVLYLLVHMNESPSAAFPIYDTHGFQERFLPKQFSKVVDGMNGMYRQFSHEQSINDLLRACFEIFYRTNEETSPTQDVVRDYWWTFPHLVRQWLPPVGRRSGQNLLDEIGNHSSELCDFLTNSIHGRLWLSS